VGEVQPAVAGFQRYRTVPILRLLDRVIVTTFNDRFRTGHAGGDIFAKRPTNSSAGSDVDKAVHRACVEGVLAVDEFRMEHDVPLLRGRCFQIGQAVPFLEILGPGDPGLGHGRGKIARLGVRIFRFGTEDPVDPTVFMEDDTHVIEVGLSGDFRNIEWLVPETEVVDAVFGFANREKALPVVAFGPDDHVHFAVPVEGTGIEGGIDSHPFHEEGIGFRVEIVAPFGRHVPVSYHRILEALKDAIVPVGIDRIGSGDKSFVIRAHFGHAFVEG